MALFKDDIEIDKKNSMSDFLFSSSNNKKTSNKSSTLMFGGEYSNNKHPDKNNSQNSQHKKIPMFADNKTSDTNNINKNNNMSYKFEFSLSNIKPYNVVNDEHQKMLVDLRSVVDYYSDIISDDDKKKIYFLIDKLKSEM